MRVRRRPAPIVVLIAWAGLALLGLMREPAFVPSCAVLAEGL